MALFSNPTARVLAILDFMAANPDRSFGLSDLARRLELNKTTCLSILTTLTQAGYLMQDPESRAYGLGPSLAAAGSAAMAQFPALEEIRAEMLGLCLERNVGGAVMARAQDHLVVMARFTPPDPVYELVRPGLRVPFAAPFGCALVAWSSRARLDEWLERAGPDGAGAALHHAELRERTLRSIAAVRSRGFEVSLDTRAERNMLDALRRLRHKADAPSLEALARSFAEELRREPYHLDEIREDEHYTVSTISVPVFEARPHPELMLLAGGFQRKVSGEEILEVAEQLRGAAARISEHAGGHFPPLPSPRSR